MTVKPWYARFGQAWRTLYGKPWYVLLGLTIGLLVLLLAWSHRREVAAASARDRDHARAVALDTFCEVKRRDLSAIAPRLAKVLHHDAAVAEFKDAFLSDDGQEEMILCMGQAAWERVSPDYRAMTCFGGSDDVCMAAMAEAAATALGGSAAK